MAAVKGKTKQQLLEENERLQARLAEAEEALRAIRKGNSPTVRRVAANLTDRKSLRKFSSRARCWMMRAKNWRSSRKTEAAE